MSERGKDEAKEDKNPEAYNKSKVEGEAEEKKRGGITKRAERKRGGKAMGGGAPEEQREERKFGGGAHAKAKKHVEHVEGEEGPKHAGRKPRKSGGRAACEASPFTSAHKGSSPKGHRTDGNVND